MYAIAFKFTAAVLLRLTTALRLACVDSDTIPNFIAPAVFVAVADNVADVVKDDAAVDDVTVVAFI